MESLNLKDKFITINVNGRNKPISKKTKKIAAESIIILAFASYETNQRMAYTVTYSRGKNKSNGSLVDGESVAIVDGMIFNVTATNRA